MLISRKSKRYVPFIVIIILIILCPVIYNLINNQQNQATTATETSVKVTVTVTPTITPIPTKKLISDISRDTQDDLQSVENNQLTLLAVGDNLMHIQVIESGKQEDGTYNFDHLFSELKSDIEAADISIINQETILGGSEFAYSGYPVFNSPTELGDAIIHAGFDVVLHATNHAMDKGYGGINNTLKYWKKHSEITVLGLNQSKKAQAKVTVIEKKGIKIAMLNYTYGLNGYKLPSDKPYLVNLLDKSKIKEDIANAKKLSDFIIVFPHWGTEYHYEPDDTQKEWTYFFAEQGVDLVIGTHPHVLEPVEWIETESGHKMLVYYSLGNYISYQKEAPRMLGGMAKITLNKDNKGVYISESSIIPIVTHYENQGDYNFCVYKLDDYSEEQAMSHGILELEEESLFTLDNTWKLARQVIGDWIYH